MQSAANTRFLLNMLSLQSLSLLALLGGTYASFHDFAFRETAHAFFHPVLPGHETSPSPVYAFLVEHKNTRLMFDLGIRKDTVNFVPSVAASFASGAFILNQSKDITELLQDGGVPLKSIDTSFGAIDYFGDGSFYLLNTPGHLLGHMSALARVTPTSFVSLGGDAFAHAGQIRPRPAFQKNFPCPAHLLEETASSISTDYFWSPHSRDGVFDMRSRAQQLLAISDVPDAFYVDPVAAQVSLDKLAVFDADPDFFVVIAHDMSLVGSLPYFPASLNGWKASGLKERTVWNFANEANPAFVFSPA
ncbi:hypothetical protein B0H17DRAFT_1205327 [Mycena rosella]|uniref:Metallo-beta-lactamase domain-containing protein n=1 Tax=Mycena rosella TaxID=1033263 RepID=A0AAD7D7X4_MYCRO|nr:hypothetical protein B0H17DRAFT_1205327 [Mycena rosella]